MRTWEPYERHGDYVIWRSTLREWRLWAWTRNQSDGTTVVPTSTSVYSSLQAARDSLAKERERGEDRPAG
jgi:hypothetical protein